MNVGIYFDLRNPPQWRQDWARLYAFTLELCEEAEHLGAHSLWVTEHHLFEDGYLTQPMGMLAAMAARTKRVRLGTAVMLAPLRPAIQMAEDAALVDILSSGRLDLGLGAGYRLPEFELYGADLSKRYTTTEQRVRELRAIWADERVTPPPVQDRIPIWMGFNGPQGARRAGRLGEHLLSMHPELLEPYREGLIEGGHDPASARMSGLVHAFVTDDPERDWPLVKPYVAYQMDSYRRYMFEGTDQPTPRPVDPDKLRERGLGRSLGYFVHTTPTDFAAQVLEHTAGAPVETVYLFASIAGMPEDLAVQHLQTICTELAPRLKAG